MEEKTANVTTAARALTFADLVKLQPKLALLEMDCLKASKKLLVRDRDWFWYEYLKPRLNDLVGCEPRWGANIPPELETVEAHTLAYDHLYSVLHRRKAEIGNTKRGRSNGKGEDARTDTVRS